MHRQTIKAPGFSTLSWLPNSLIDWKDCGREFLLNGQIIERGSYSFDFSFDSAITSADGMYAVIYKKLGTKGLLLKNGEVLREINRSYYQAEVYEYPAAFARLKDGRTILIHCPHEYCQVDFEDVETGERLTHHADRKPSDFFHSRFEVSPDNQTFLSKGWAWHPFDFIQIYNIEECIENPLLLDKPRIDPDVDGEICTASFITNSQVLIGSPKEGDSFNDQPSDKLRSGQIAIWDINSNTVSNIITPAFAVGGNLIAIDDTFAWELFKHPKIVNYRTGETIDEIAEINSGDQISSIIHHLENLPIIAINRLTKQVAICKDYDIEILSK
jgi:hypothetical protein